MTTQEILEAARAARSALALADGQTRTQALWGMADWLCHPDQMDAILAANAEDMAAAKGHISDVMLDRLALTPERIGAMARGILDVAALPDPVGAVLNRIQRPNGLLIEKTAVPMGVIAIIYESRPNVTSDAAALAIKSGNACVLRCGRDAWASCHAIVNALRCGLARAGLPESAVSLIEDTTHASANELMTANGLVDLLIPRGGAGLIRACVENATVPCIQTGTGICHVYVDKAADLNMAVDIIENAKTSRPSVCNAEEVCLVHKDVAAGFLPLLKARLVDARAAAGLVPVDLRLDERAAAIIPGTPAGEQDFDTEFLNYILAIAVVDDVDAAIAHIARHSTHHSEAIITADDTAADRFTTCVDSAAVYVNASTRFTDGGEFGLGCEMGISTQKLHARGPMGLAELCSYKYIIHGSGQTRGGSAAKLQNPCN
jgi:glutamate-5-semialdehyde dehydrogenase